MSRDKSVWFAEEILLDAKLINYQLESGEWDAVEEMLRAEAQLSRDAETGRLRPKKASEYTLRLIAEVLHIMRLDVEQGSHTRATLAVAEQCLRLVRSCAAAGTKIQTYISKELSILDSMLALATAYHRSPPPLSTQLSTQFQSCITVLMQTLGNLVVNNPYNQIIVWDKFDSVIVEALASGGAAGNAAAMLVYNILLGQPHLLPDDPVLLNALADLHASGHTSYPHLVLEYLATGESAYLEKLMPRLEPEARALCLATAHHALTTHADTDVTLSVNFVRFLAQEFKLKSDCILKTVDKYLCGVEPGEVVVLLDILGAASSMDPYLDALQSDASLFINCAFLLRAIHQLGKETSNFFTSINKLYTDVGRGVPEPTSTTIVHAVTQPDIPLCKNDSADTLLSCLETQSECTESESSEQYYECSDHVPSATVSHARAQSDASAESPGTGCSRKTSLEHKIDMEAALDSEPPLIVDACSPHHPPAAPLHPLMPVTLSSPDISPDDPITEIQMPPPSTPALAAVGTTSSAPVAVAPVSAAPVAVTPVSAVPVAVTPVSAVPVAVATGAVASVSVAPVAAASIAVAPIAVADTTSTPPAAATGASSDPAPGAPIAGTGATVGAPIVGAGAPSSGATSPPLTSESAGVKKSQNLSTDFNLSEQLEKILGISTEKARSGGEAGSGGGKEEQHVRPVPSVKIESPERHKSRPGEPATDNVKVVVSDVRSVEQHVAFGFKAGLVRLLANLCWKHPVNKRMMRELDVIPVLLDCCNVDERNPLIMQWVIFAVRNLCENCPENQAIIAQMSLQKPVQSSLLQDMGISLHTHPDGRTLRIAPLRTEP